MVNNGDRKNYIHHKLVLIVGVTLSACSSGEGSSPLTPAQITEPAHAIMPSQGAEPFKIVCTGQSNMLGSNRDASGEKLENENVQVWLDGWKVSTLHEAPYQLKSHWHVAPNNLCHWFGIRVHEETGRPVEIAFHAIGSKTITLWREDAEMWKGIKAAGSAAFTEDDPADVILWGQGEQNHTWPVEQYKVEFLDIIERLKAEPWVSEDAPTLVMELNPGSQYDGMNALHSNWDGPEIWTASGRGLSGDGFAGSNGKVHYSGQSLQEIGYERMWTAWNKSQE